MSDVNANIGVQIDTSMALAELKNLQRQLAQFHAQVSKSSAAAAAAQKNLQTNLINSINATGKFRAQMGVVRTSTESFTNSLEKNKFSMREYFRYGMGATRTFGKAFKSEFDTIGKVAEERVKRMQTQYIKMGRDANGAMKAIAITPTSLNMKDYGNQVAVAAQKQQLLNQLLKQGSTNLLNFGKNTQWAGRQLMVGFTVPLAYFGTAAAKTFMDLEAQAIKFRRVYGDMFTTTAETDKALQNIQDLANEFTKYGVAVTKTMEMAASAAAMGKTGAELTAQVAEATRLAVLGGVEQQQALDTTISLTNAFGIAAEDLTSKINFLNAVENQTVVSIEDLTIAIPKAGPVVQQLGGSVEDLAFFLTAMREGGINASEGANALKSGLASLINPTNKASKMFADMGINIKDIVERNKGDLKRTVIEFAQALDTLDPLNRARGIEQLFGKFQFARLSTLFQNVTKDGTQAAKVLQMAGASVEELAILSERELKAVEDAVGTNFKAAVEQLKVSIAPIGKEFLKAITPVVKFLGNLLDKFNNLSDGSKKFIVVLTTLVGLVGPTLLMTFGLLANGAANIIKMFVLMRQGFLKLSGNTSNLAQQTQYMSTEQMEAATVAASLNQTHARLTQQFVLEADAVRLLRNAYIDATTAASRFAAANPGMMIPGAGRVPKAPGKFASGTTGVVGGESGKDSVPALLMPGEAVVPTKIAQDDKFKPLISALVSGDIAKYGDGTENAGSNRVFAHSVSPTELRGSKASQRSKDFGFTREKLYTAIGFDIDAELNQRLDKSSISLGEYRRAVQDKESLSTMTRKLIESGVPPRKAHAITKEIRNNFLKSTAGLPDNTNINDKWVYSRMGNDKTGIIGSLIKSRDPVVATAMKELYFGGTKSMGGTTTLAKAFENIKKTNPGAMMALASIDDILRAVAGKMGKNGTDPLNNLKKLYPDIELPVIKDSKGNIIGYQRPEVHSDGVLSKQKFNIGLLRGDKFEAERTIGSSSRKIRLADWSSRTYDQLIGKKVAVKPGQKAIDLETGAKVQPRPVPLTAADKKRIPASQRLSHTRALMLRRGQGIPALGATAEDGEFMTGNKYTQTASGLLVPEKVIREQIDSLNKNTESQTEGTKSQDKNTDTQEKSSKEIKRDQRAARAQRIGGYAGPVAMAAGTAGMVAAMAGAPQTMTNFLFGVSAVSGLLPLLANPLGAAIAGIATLGIALYKFNSDINKARQEGAALAKSMTMTNSKLIELSKITGTVSASEAAKRKRETILTGASGVQRKTGQTILESGFGKTLLSDIEAQQKQGASNAEVAKSVGLGLSTAIMQGVLTTEQAKSLAAALGEKLGSYDIPAQISGTIVSLVGPNGERLESEPLQVALNIKKQSMEQQAKVFQNAMSQRQPQNTAANTALTVGGIAAGAMAVTAATGGLAAPAALAVSIAALGKAAWDQNKAKAANLKLDTAAIQLGLEAVSQGQGLVDSLNKQYDNKLKQAKTEAEIAQIEKDRKTAIDAVNAENAKTLDILLKQKDQFTSGAFDAAIKAAADTMYKEGPMAVFKDEALKALNGLENSDFKTTLQLGFASGQMDPNQIIALINMASKNEDIKKNIELIVSQSGMAEANVLIGLLEKAGANESTYKIITSIADDNPESTKKVQDALAVISNILPEYGVNVDINTNGEKKLKEVMKYQQMLAGMPNPLTKDTIIKLSEQNPDDQKLKDILANWNELSGGAKTIDKTVVTRFAAVYDDKNVQNFYTSSTMGTGDANVPQHIKDYVSSNVDKGKSATYLLQQKGKGEKSGAGGGSSAGGGGGDRDTTLDDLLKRLKFIGDAAINAEGGVSELMRITKGGGITKLSGVMQQLMAGPKGGFNREFIGFLEQMDNKTRAIYMTEKKGKVILTDKGKALKEAFNEKTIREYQVTQVQSIQDTLAQRAALLKLKAAGIDNATALEMVSDASLAVAINSEKISSAELQNMAKNAEEAKKQIKDLNLEVQNLGVSIKDRITNLNSTITALAAARKAGITGEDILQYIASNQSLADQIASKGINDPKVQEILKNQPKISDAEATVEGMINPLQKVQADFDKARAKADAFYNFLENQANAAYKSWLQNTKATFEGVEYSISDAIDKIQEKIDSINKDIEQKQRDIEIKYDRPVEKLQREIDDIQRGIEIQFERPIEQLQKEIDVMQRSIEINFDRPIQALQDESGRLSNDLTLIDHATDAINKKYDAQEEALNKISEINQDIIAQEKQRLGLASALTSGDIAAAAQAAQDMRAAAAERASQNAGGVLAKAREAEIAGLTSASGMTKAQIEERQFQIGQQTFALEQKRALLQAQILAKQDAIYALEQAKLPQLELIRQKEDQIYKLNHDRLADVDAIQKLEDQIYNLTKNQLEPLQTKLEKQEKILKAELDAIEAQRTKWDQTQLKIDAAKLKADGFDTTMKGIEAKTANMLSNWQSIDDKVVTLTVHTVYTYEGTPPNTSGGGGGGNGGAQVKMYGGKITRMASGGYVPGIGMTDKVPALLTPGEFVLNKAATKQFGPLLESLNNSKYPSMINGNMTTPKYNLSSEAGNIFIPVQNTDASISDNSSTVYNYSIGITVGGTSASADSIAQTVLNEIKYIDSQRIRGQKA